MSMPIDVALFGFADCLGNSVAVGTMDLLAWELVGEVDFYYRIIALLCIAYFIRLEQQISYEKLGLAAPLAYHLMPSPGGMLFVRAIHRSINLQGLDRRPYPETPKIVYYLLVSVPYVITGLLTAKFMALLSWSIPNYWIRLFILFIPNIGETITVLSAATSLLGAIAGVDLPTAAPTPRQVASIIGSGFKEIVTASGYPCRALMRTCRFSTLLFLEILDDFQLRRSWILIQRELNRRKARPQPSSNPAKPYRLSEDPIYHDLMINSYEQKFRVLRILKGAGPLLECRLSVVSLADETTKGPAQAPYEAFSYRWRVSEKLPEFPIVINKHTFHVQPNVYRLLRDVRLPDKDRCIWIDSICINQNDEADRDMQIPLMYQIYSQAERVISWLADSREGMGGITALKGVVRNGLPNDSDLWYIINTPFSFQLVAWMKIVEFLRHDYFTRMWMIQEVALSKKLTMIKGKEELDWSEFATILPHLHSSQGERFLREPNSFGRWYLDSRVTHGIKGALSMHAARELLTRESLDAMDLLMLPKQLQLVQNRINTSLSGHGRRLRRLPLSAYGVLAQLLSLPDVQSTVPEDKIYGISGLLEHTAQQPVVFGEDAGSTSNILRDFASKLLRQQERTFPPYFVLAGWGYKELSSPTSSSMWKDKKPQFLTFPSWVPDIYEPRISNPAIDGLYLAGTAELKRVSTVAGSDELLRISMSRVIGTIANITESALSFPDPPDPSVMLNNIRTFIAEAQTIAGLYQDNHRGSPYLYPRDAFTRTILGDILAAASPFPPIPPHMVGALEHELDILLRNPNVAHGPHGILFELGRSLGQHRFCVLSSGHFGLVPLGCKTGDGVVIVWGAQTPFALRRATVEEKVVVGKQSDGLQDQWVLLGSCYLHGFMDEQATRAVWGDRDVVVR